MYRLQLDRVPGFPLGQFSPILVPQFPDSKVVRVPFRQERLEFLSRLLCCNLRDVRIVDSATFLTTDLGFFLKLFSRRPELIERLVELCHLLRLLGQRALQMRCVVQ